MLGSGEECLPSSCCELRGAMGILQHEVLHDERRVAGCKDHASNVCARVGVCLFQDGRAGSAQDDMTFVGSAAALNRSWNVIEGTLADAGHRLCGYKREVWAPGFEQFEDAELPMEVRNLCLRIPRKRHPWVCSEHAALHACRPGPTW